ncbi:MAG TPA: arginine--tRNA ligase [Firmicutes bacterium]|jgi:arginyl-tRNA synthetase|nr:arginine--tRNA ligase [Bacillota bacterium]HBL69459.1 arginine--tRNA ligase [Bacillota bacterium]HCT36392.1 arginine--tRNA ligase [Bacillota bacterium]HCX69681.1 arginine--tRNA ligase [Bacillota bacterium]
MKTALIELLTKHLAPDLTADEIGNLLEIPPDETLADYALPCFALAKKLRKSPAIIAADLASKIADDPIIAEAKAVSGYLNVFLDRSWLSARVLELALAPQFGAGGAHETTVVEFCSPNTNKPLHLGHLRNIAIGESVSRILSFNGNKVYKTCIFNDRGVHICKSMLAYRDFGGGTLPGDSGTKPDHFVGDYYVLFAKKAKEDPTYEDQAQQMLEQWEAGDAEVVALWRTMNGWAFEGFRETFDLFGTSFDREYYESQIYKKGREIILDGLARGLFQKKEDGPVVVDLADIGLDEKVLLRSNGTSVYIVQDIYLAHLKAKEFNYDRSIYVVGNEQEYHFKVLKAILDLLDTECTGGRVHHLSHGMIELPEGKMKSREGTVVDADDFIWETAALAAEEVNKRWQLSEAEVKERSLKIALAAIKYQLLKTETGKNMVFNPKEALRFEGDTGPYVLYSYARASSILRKSDVPLDANPWEVSEFEVRLLKKIYLFTDIVKLAGARLTPSTLSNYLFDLCRNFNEFYHECPVLRSEVAGQRLALVTAFRNVCGQCLELLGIEKIEEM